MTHDEIQHLADTWCQPISAELPCGNHARYEKEYEQLLVEMHKLEAIDRSEPNWIEVERLTSELLRDKTKDLTVLGALCVSLLKTRGWQGLAAALMAYDRIVQSHWSAMFPTEKRLRGRVAAYTWLTIQLQQDISDRQSEPTNLIAVKICQETFERLDNFMRERFADAHPRVGAVKAKLVEAVASADRKPEATKVVEKPHVVAAHADVTPASVSPVVKDEAASAVSAMNATDVSNKVAPEKVMVDVVASEADAAHALDQAVTLIRRTAAYRLKQAPSKPFGYHLAAVASLLGTTPDSELKHQPLSPKALSELHAAIASEDPRKVAQFLAAQIESSDLTLNALQSLSRFFEAAEGDPAPIHLMLASHAIGTDLRMSGASDASSDTLGWLAEQLASAAERRPLSPADPVSADQEDNDNLSIEAQAALTVAEAAKCCRRKNGLSKACEVLQRAIDKTHDRRLRFHLRLGMAKLCLKAETPEFARPLLQDLQEELREAVGKWDPDLLIDVLRARMSCNRILRRDAPQKSDDLERENSELLSALARLNPAAAYEEQQKA